MFAAWEIESQINEHLKKMPCMTRPNDKLHLKKYYKINNFISYQMIYMLAS